MNIASTLLVLLIALATAAGPASAQSKSGVEKLYIINCGEGVAANPGRHGLPGSMPQSCF
jgi:hypothetical protein